MCGIVALAGSAWDLDSLGEVTATLSHRGPDGSGVWVDPHAEVGLGHTRLSIIDTSDAGSQPMSDRDGNITVTFNGEIYNHVELRSQLEDYPFVGRSDTEVLLASYLKWGADCLQRFNGMFAFVIWDSLKHELFAARDRLGIKPLYFTTRGKSIGFSSEIKALLAAGVSPRLDRSVLRDYLVDGYYDHTPGTFFKGVRQVEPGTFMRWSGGEGAVTRYWALRDYLQPEQYRPWNAETAAELGDLVHSSVALRLRSDVPVGLHLSGGLDSSVVFSAVDEIRDPEAEIRAFTGTYGHPEYDEAIHVDSLTRRSNVSLSTVSTSQDESWDLQPEVQWHQEQPFGGFATILYWNLERQVKASGTTVVLEGQGGDELFGGYRYYVDDYLGDLRTGTDSSIETWVRRFAAIHGESPSHLMTLVGAPEVSEARYQDGSHPVRPQFLRPEVLRHEGTGFGSALTQSTAGVGRFRRARYRDLRHAKLPRVLRFNDRMSMASGVELRVPLLDHRLVEFAFSLSDHALLRRGWPKAPLREAFPRLDDSIRLAAKRAVVTPQREWLRGAWAGRVRDTLRSSALGDLGIAEPSRLLEGFEHYCNDPGVTNSFFVWQWLNLDCWIKTFGIDS